MKNSYNFSKDETLCIKALAILLMLLHHLFTFPEKLTDGASFTNLYTMSDGRTIEYLFGNYGKLCVALFMMLSGYGMYCSYKNNKDNITSSIAKRIKGVYIKYWQVFIIFVPLGLLLGSEKISHLPVDWITNFFAINTTFNDETWFLTIYIIIICMSPAILRWFERKHSNPWIDMIIIMAFSALANTALISFTSTNPYLTDFYNSYFWQKMMLALIMLPMFATGCFLAKYDLITKVRNSIKSGVAVKLIGIALLIISFIMRANWSNMNGWGWDKLDYIYAALFCIASVLILDGFKYIKKSLVFIGKQATGIWFIHTYLCYYYFQNIMYAPKNPVLIFLFVLSLSLLIAWGLNIGFGYLWIKLTTLYDSYSKKKEKSA